MSYDQLERISLVPGIYKALRLLLAALTDDRINETLARLGRLDRSERVTGQPGAALVMAAFCPPAPGGGRFNDEALGAWYCASEIETVIAETVYHHTRRLAHSADGFRHVIQMRELVSDVDAEICDLRGLRESRPELYDPESYAASQPFGEALRRAGANGVKLRRKPKLTAHQRREAIRRRDRDGEPVTTIARSYNVSHSTISRLAA